MSKVPPSPGASQPSTRPISRWPVPSVMELPDDLKARILEVQDKAGFVPNVFLALAHRPEEPRVPTTACTVWWPMAPSCASTRKSRS